MNPYKVVEDFEQAIAEYTGSLYVVAVSSCTAALHLCCEYMRVKEVMLPRYTYVGVAQSILNAGGTIKFTDDYWYGHYQLHPYGIVDSARWFSGGMYSLFSEKFVCVSFHASKTLGIEMGGAILLDDPRADAWFRKARFDGRTPGVDAKMDTFSKGWHYPMPPSIAAQGLLKLHSLPKFNAPIPNSDYPDLSKQEAFK